MSFRGGKRSPSKNKMPGKCAGENDPVSLEPIPDKYAIRIYFGTDVPRKYHCFDIRTLLGMFKRGQKFNPLTRQPFDAKETYKIVKKYMASDPFLSEHGAFTLKEQEAETIRMLHEKFNFTVYLKQPGIKNFENLKIAVFDKGEPVLQSLPTGIDVGYEIITNLGSGAVVVFTKNLESYILLLIELTKMFGHTNEESTDGMAWTG
jgi:hypothetical protein